MPSGTGRPRAARPRSASGPPRGLPDRTVDPDDRASGRPGPSAERRLSRVVRPCTAPIDAWPLGTSVGQGGAVTANALRINPVRRDGEALTDSPRYLLWLRLAIAATTLAFAVAGPMSGAVASDVLGVAAAFYAALAMAMEWSARRSERRGMASTVAMLLAGWCVPRARDLRDRRRHELAPVPALPPADRRLPPRLVPGRAARRGVGHAAARRAGAGAGGRPDPRRRHRGRAGRRSRSPPSACRRCGSSRSRPRCSSPSPSASCASAAPTSRPWSRWAPGSRTRVTRSARRRSCSTASSTATASPAAWCSGSATRASSCSGATASRSRSARACASIPWSSGHG